MPPSPGFSIRKPPGACSNSDTSTQAVGLRGLSRANGVQLPVAIQRLDSGFARLCNLDSGARHQVRDGARNQYLSGLCQRTNLLGCARGCLVARRLLCCDLADVHSGPATDIEAGQPPSDFQRAMQAARRAVEAGDRDVVVPRYFPATVNPEMMFERGANIGHQAVVFLRSRVGVDLDTQNRGQYRIGFVAARGALQELLDRGDCPAAGRA
jgi:hypothetical protein